MSAGNNEAVAAANGTELATATPVLGRRSFPLHRAGHFSPHGSGRMRNPNNNFAQMKELLMVQLLQKMSLQPSKEQRRREEEERHQEQREERCQDRMMQQMMLSMMAKAVGFKTTGLNNHDNN